MFKFVAFKTQKPRSFTYRPLHYDPDKEARDERRKELWAQRGVFDHPTNDKTEGSKEYQPGQFIQSRKERRVANSYDQARGSNRVKIFSILVFIIVLGYWIFSN